MIAIAVTVAVAALCGWAVCRVAGRSPYVLELCLAAMVALFAGIIGQVPMILTRGVGTPLATRAQSALIGTAVHLAMCVALGAALALSHIGSPQATLLWMLPLYWVTLVALVILFVRELRSAEHAGRQQA